MERNSIFGGSQLSVGPSGKLENRACFEGKIIKHPIEILCHAGALMHFWTGLYADVDKEMLVNGVNTLLRVAASLIQWTEAFEVRRR
jgi:hypothetical protein